MKHSAHDLAKTGLQWFLGLVLIYECSRLLFAHGAAELFAKTHLPQWFRIAIAAVELLGAFCFCCRRRLWPEGGFCWGRFWWPLRFTFSTASRTSAT